MPTGSDADASIAQRLRAGDPGVLADLAAAWGPRLYRYFLRMGATRDDAQDLTQEALLRTVRAVRGRRLPDALAPWLYTVAGNLLRDHHRSPYRRRVSLAEPDADPAAEAGPEHTLEERTSAVERRAAVSQALRGLPPDLREVVVLRFWEGQPVKSIAGIVGIPEGTVKSRLYRAYRRLESQLATWHAAPEGGEGRA